MKVKFRFFWKNFNINNNIFLYLFSELKSDTIFKIEMHSVFVKPRKLYSYLIFYVIRFCKLRDKLIGRKNFYIWYSGELIVPPSKYDLTLSFKKNTPKNIYWPLWATYIDTLNSGKKYEREFIFNQQELLASREITITEKHQWKICAFVSNDVAWRNEIISKLNKFGCIDIYGEMNGMRVDSKYNIAKNYVFQFCFENTLCEGYVTEKPIEAWLCGNIPIYAGGDTYGYLNKSAMIDCSEIPSAKIADYILKEITLKKENYSRIIEPILSKKYDFDKFRQIINKI